MSAVGERVLTRHPEQKMRLFHDSVGRAQPVEGARDSAGCPGGGRLTLEARLSSVWEGLHASGAAECPMCQGRMESDGEGGRCSSCGSRLS